MNLSEDNLLSWNNNRLINPITNRAIKENGPTFKKILKKYNEYLNKKNKIENFYKLCIIKKIQKKCRNRYLSKISGPGYDNPLLCNNERDIISLDKIWENKDGEKVVNLEFDKKLLFTYESNNIIFGMNIESLETLLKKKIFKDPFTNVRFSNSTLNKIKNKILFLRKIKYNKNKTENYDIKQIINNKIINIIKILEKSDIYIDFEWLNKLNKNSYIKLYRELNDIFLNYKHNYIVLYNQMIKKNYFVNDIHQLRSNNFNNLKNIIYSIILSILNENKEEHIQKICVYIITGALCYVSNQIKEAYPLLELV